MADRPQDVLDVLRQARARLQTLLEVDEHWRALTRGPTPAGDPDAAARRARDMRLEMALATNAAYRAWRHVGEAIAVLSSEKSEKEAPAPVPSAGAAPGDASELPPHIADLLRRRAAEEARLAGTRRAPQRPPELPASAPRNAPAAQQTAPQGAAGEDQLPTVAEEAAVTFVAREPVATAEGGRPPALRERLRALAVAGARPATFSPPQAGAEEADVEIVSEEIVRERRTDEERAAAVANFRKMLLGE